MIYQKTMYGIRCDNCQEDFEGDHDGIAFTHLKEDVLEKAINRDWHQEGNEHYCNKCWHFNDEDKLVINSARTKEPAVYRRKGCVFKYCPSEAQCRVANKCLNG
jgi:hypothetical protein